MTATFSPRLRRIAIFAAATSVVFLVAIGLANVAVVRGGSAGQRDAVADLEPAPVAIVLGAGVRPDGSPTQVLEDRLTQAVELHRAGKARKLLISGDHHQVGYDEANGMRRWVVERGVPPEDVFCDHAGLSTWDTFVRARTVFGVTRAIVVTQRFHLTRALYTARENGIEAQGAPCDAREYEQARWYALREIAARCKAWVQALGIASSARIGGPPISIEGDGRVTWDGADGARAVR